MYIRNYACVYDCMYERMYVMHISVHICTCVHIRMCVYARMFRSASLSLSVLICVYDTSTFWPCSYNAQFLLPIHKQNLSTIACTTYVTKDGFAV
jgi:hypothetical protein